MSNSKLNKPKLGIKNGAQITLNVSSNVIGNSNDETNFPHKSLLADTQVPRLHKSSENSFSAHIKLSKTQLSKMVQLGRISLLILWIHLV